MAYRPISGTVPQYTIQASGTTASGYWLKFYEQGTPTSLPMGIDATPTSTLVKCTLNSLGQPISNPDVESTRFIPHLNAAYDAWIFPTEALADANNTAAGTQVADNVKLDNSDFTIVATYAAARALDSSTLTDGQLVWKDGFAYPWRVKTGTVTDNGWYLVFTDDSNRYLESTSPVVSVDIFAGTGTGATNGIQEAVDYVASLSNGGTVVLPESVNLISSSIIWKPKVSFYLEKGAIIRADTGFTNPMIDNPVGLSNRITKISMAGKGEIDCNFTASSALRLRECAQIEISGVSLTKCNEKYIHIGDASQVDNCFELNIHDMNIYRNGSAFTTESPYGIYVDPAAPFFVSDSWFSELIINGCKYGIDGSFSYCEFARIHPWSNVPADGIMDTGFWIKGNYNTLLQCISDNFDNYGYRFDGVGNRLGYSKVNRGTDFADNTGDAVYLDAGATLTAKDNFFRTTSSSHRLASEFAGDLAGLTAEDNESVNIVDFWGNYGPGKFAASIAFTTNAGTTPTLEQSYKCSVARVGTGDYVINFLKTFPNDDYAWTATYTDFSIEVVRAVTIATTSLRLQFYNGAGTLTDPVKTRVMIWYQRP